MKNKRERGITLIALVITIIVLLILAAVSIATLTGENGILTRAGIAKENTIIGEEKEAIKTSYNGVKTNNLAQGVTAEELQDELNKNGYETVVTERYGKKMTVRFLESKNMYVIKNMGEINKLENTKDGIILASGSSGYNMDVTVNYFLKNSGELVKQIIPESLREYNVYNKENDEKIADNVADAELGRWYITNNHELYDFDNNLICTNIKKIDKEAGYAWNDKNDVYSLSTLSLILKNVKKIEGEYIIDGDNNLYAYLYGQGYVKIAENVKKCFYDNYFDPVYFIDMNDDLYEYYESQEKLIHNNVKDKSVYYFITNDNVLYRYFRNSEKEKRAENVRTFNDDSYFITNDNTLYRWSMSNKIAENVKTTTHRTYIDLDNRLHLIDENKTVVLNDVKEYVDYYFVIDKNNDLYEIMYENDAACAVDIIAHNVEDFGRNNETGKYYAFGEKNFLIGEFNYGNREIWNKYEDVIDYNENLILTSTNDCYNYYGEKVMTDVVEIGKNYYVKNDGNTYYYVEYDSGVR